LTIVTIRAPLAPSVEGTGRRYESLNALIRLRA
jgi:hypothetical protein